jgi:hypothetical protein
MSQCDKAVTEWLTQALGRPLLAHVRDILRCPQFGRFRWQSGRRANAPFGSD